MKMSDVFNSDLVPTDTTTGMQSTSFGLADGGLVLRRLDHMQAAAHAINQHDALTQLNKELVEALERTLVSACDPYACGEDFCDHILEIIAKAKELAE